MDLGDLDGDDDAASGDGRLRGKADDLVFLIIYICGQYKVDDDNIAYQAQNSPRAMLSATAANP